MTTTIMVPHPAPTDDPETGASEAKAKTLTDWRAESKSRRSIEWLEMHLSTLVGSTAFLLSALFNFSSIYFRFPQQTGRTRTSDMVIVATLRVSSTVYTGRGRVAGIIPTHDPTVVAGPVSWLYGIYVISGMLNVLALVGLYRWWREEKNRARKW
ncbi:hypothetical protein D9757_007549 [Collybiopsis confluens]|uniref:Uncharacterized protein n=1 Tax=Collybiopsis confluens TaxID=2823264 RepID=A0A8H5HE81_9AGAR|nr:hypothetical protein D9757_007549 [Collybiopsis confluens]